MANTPAEASRFLDSALGEQVAESLSPSTVTVPASTEPAQQAIQAEQRLLRPSLSEAAPATTATLNAAETALRVVAAPVSALGTLATRATARRDPTGLSLLGQREGVPFDVTTGTSIMSRLSESLAFNREEVSALLKRQPNVTDVRFNRLGEPVMTVRDPDTGEVRDVLADPIGFDAGDLAFVAANAPEMIAGGLAALGVNAPKRLVSGIQRLAQAITRRPRAGQTAASLTAAAFKSKALLPSAARMAVGGQAAGLGKEVVARQVADLPHEAVASTERRATMVTADFVFGLGAGVVGKVIGRAITPLGKRGPLQVRAEAAQDIWDRAGVRFDLTPAEMSGSPFLGHQEAFLARKPGSSIPFDAMMAERRAATTKAQGILLGADPESVPRADLFGRDMTEAVQARLASLDWVVSRETQSLAQAATGDIRTSLASATRVPQAVEQQAVGQNLFNRAFELWDRFRSESSALYDKVTGHPAIVRQGRNLSVDDLATDADAILAKVASVEREVEVPVAGLVDEFNAPITRTTTETSPLRTFTDSNVRARLEELSAARGGRVSYHDLIRLRRDLDDDLYRGSLLRGIPERDLQELRTAITTRIEEGLQQLDDTGALLTDWRAATSHRATGMRSFKDLDIVNIFKDPETPGVLSVNKIVSRATRDPDVWDAYRSFFGPDSDQMNLLRRFKADEVLGRIEGSDVVDATAFLRRMDALQQAQPAIANDVFGTQSTRLRGFALAAEQAGKKQVNVTELADLIDNNSLTATRLQALIDAQAQRTLTLRNEIFGKLAKGVTGPDAIRDADVEKLFLSADPSDVRELVLKLSTEPATLDAARQRVLTRIFYDASGDVAGHETLTSQGLSHYLDDPTMRARLEPVIGAERLTHLTALRDALAPGGAKETTFKAAAGISVGQQVGQFQDKLHDPVTMFAQMSRITRAWLTATLYKAGPVRNFLANTTIGNGGVNRAAFVNAFVVGEPVVEELVRFFGNEAARMTATELKAAIDGEVRRGDTAEANTPEMARRFMEQQ